MSRDSGLPSYERNPPKKNPQRQVGASAVGAAVASVAPKPPVEKPQRALQKIGFQGGIQEFNNRLQQAHDAHLAAKGFEPPAGLALDVARSPVPTDQIPKLFAAGSATVGRLAGTLQGLDRTLSTDPGADLLKRFEEANKQGRYADFMKENSDQITELAQSDPKFANKFATMNVQAYGASFVPEPRGIHKLFAAALTGVGQVTEGLVFGPPTLAITEGKAAYASGAQKSLKPLGKTNVKLAKGVVKGVEEDVHHPLKNPGYLFLDIFSALSIGAGGAARVASAGKALSRGEAGAAAKALVARPQGGRIEMRRGDHAEERLGSENMMVNAVQRLKQRGANARMQARLEGDDTPAGVLGILRPLAARDFLARRFDALGHHWGDEAKLRREMGARYIEESKRAQGLRNEIERTAGWAWHTAKVYDKMPKKTRRGLTVGEQKAIEVLTLDDPTPLETMRAMHLKAITDGVGSPEGHRAHLAALDLAEKVLANPSKRFRRALRITHEVLDEQQRIKIDELGLSPVDAEHRIVANGHVYRTGEKVSPEADVGERQTEHGRYFPNRSVANTKRRPGGRDPITPRNAGYGFGPAQTDPALKHQFTGSSILNGDSRIDSTNLAAESYATTVRSLAIKNRFDDLWKMSTEKPHSPDDKPIRDIREVSDKLREVTNKLEAGLITEKDASQISQSALDDIHKFIYPDANEGVENVRWLHPSLVNKEHAPSATAYKMALGIFNEPIKFLTLFARPAYILNLLGSSAMALFHQGHHTPFNVLRALHGTSWYGRRIETQIDSIVGEGRTRSYVDNKLALPGAVAARMWGRITDTDMRRSSFYHEMTRLGYDFPFRKMTDAERTKMEKVLGNLAEEVDSKNVTEAGRRANKSMVQFDNLSWAEREHIKHYIFIYPWASRSLVWSIRSVVEHPVKSTILAQIGKESMQEHPEFFNKVPEWFKQTGYIPTGVDKNGNPKVRNTSSINTFTSLAQTWGAVQAGFLDGGPGSQSNSLGEMLGPTGKFLVHWQTGRDDFGNPYPGPDFESAAMDVLLAIPQVSAYQRANKTNPDLNPIDITKRSSLEARLNSGLKRTVFSPGWLGGYGMLISGGLTERTADREALLARYWRDQPIEKRHAMEKNLLQRALQMQGDLLDRKVPAELKTAVDVQTGLAWRHKTLINKDKALGRTPTTLEMVRSDITFLRDRNQISEAVAEKLLKKTKTIETKKDLENFQGAVKYQYGGGKDLADWDTSVRFVASFTHENLQAQLHALGGLSDIKRVTASQEELYAAGRQALSFTEKVKKMRADASDLPRGESDLKLAELRAFIDAEDKPIKVNGKVVAPSPVRLDWAKMSQKDRDSETRSLTRRSWGSMTNFEKEIVGKKVAPNVSEGWAELAKLKADYKAQNFTSPTSDQVTAVARALDQRYPGFYEDYLFSVKPNIQRFETLKPYQNMPPAAKAKFNEIAGLAKQFVSAMKSGNYTSSELRQTWTTYVNETLKPWLNEPDKVALRNWLEPYGPNFLSSLIGR